MVHLSYLRQHLEVSLDFRDVRFALKPSLTYVFQALSQLRPRNTEYFNVTVRYQKTNARLALSLSYHS